MQSEDVIVLCPQEVITLDVGPVQSFREALGDEPLGFWAEDAVEEMVVSLASVEAAWAAGEFRRLCIGVHKVIGLADRTGLQDVAKVARVLADLLKGSDPTAIAAVTARLVRVGETSLATLLEIGHRHV
ncbi:MAG: hypothetical protein ABJF50_03135 [Paracoccaceae bacterium]